MNTHYRRYTEEFKRETLELLRSGDKSAPMMLSANSELGSKSCKR